MSNWYETSFFYSHFLQRFIMIYSRRLIGFGDKVTRTEYSEEHDARAQREHKSKPKWSPAMISHYQLRLMWISHFNPILFLLGTVFIEIDSDLLLLPFSIVVKRFREPPEIRRSWEVWWYDTSKQGIGAIAIHLANVYLSPLFQGDPCTWYVINFLLDSTIGLLIVFIGIRLCQFLANYKKWPAINFGVYGKNRFEPIQSSSSQSHSDEWIVDFLHFRCTKVVAISNMHLHWPNGIGQSVDDAVHSMEILE